MPERRSAGPNGPNGDESGDGAGDPARFSGEFWAALGTEWKGISAALGAGFVAGVVAATVSAFWKPVLAPDLNIGIKEVASTMISSAAASVTSDCVHAAGQP